MQILGAVAPTVTYLHLPYKEFVVPVRHWEHSVKRDRNKSSSLLRPSHTMSSNISP